MGAHAGRGGIGKLGEGERAMGGDESIAAMMFLLPVPASPMVCQLSSMMQSVVGRRKNPGFGAPSGLRNHAAEELPLRIVAAAAEAAGARHQIAAVRRDRLRYRGVGPGGERTAVAPDLVLRRARKTRDEPLVRGQQAIDPAGRAATARDRRLDLRRTRRSRTRTRHKPAAA